MLRLLEGRIRLSFLSPADLDGLIDNLWRLQLFRRLVTSVRCMWCNLDQGWGSLYLLVMLPRWRTGSQDVVSRSPGSSQASLPLPLNRLTLICKVETTPRKHSLPGRKVQSCRNLTAADLTASGLCQGAAHLDRRAVPAIITCGVKGHCPDLGSTSQRRYCGVLGCTRSLGYMCRVSTGSSCHCFLLMASGS